MSKLIISVGRKSIFTKFSILSRLCSSGTATHFTTQYNPVVTILPLEQPWLTTISLPGQEKRSSLFKFPEQFTIFSQKAFFLFPSANELTKSCPPSFNNGDNLDRSSSTVLDQADNDGVYYMGSLLKKRRRKMNRQKYRKRRNRDRFKREALKNLREKKKQQKERAFNRKQTMLSRMVMNKSISKRRARYLSHKLLPGVAKEQYVN